MPAIGTSPLTEAITAGVTPGHVAASVEVHRQFNADIFANCVNVMSTEYGAVDGGSAATNTTALNNARADIVASGKPGSVFIPAGVDLPVTPDGVIGASDVTYWGGGKLSTTQTAAGSLITFPADSSNFDVIGLVFESPNNSMTAVKVTTCSDYAIVDIRCINATITTINESIATYADISTDPATGNVCRDFSIRNNRAKLTAASTSTHAGILLFYGIGGEIVGNRIEGYDHGIQWWGGDANPSIDGALANERKCGELTITANRTKDISGAGIWGSMGYGITVTANVVDDCGDVGVDFEGCFDCTATANTVRNCANGNLTTFSYNRNILFVGNTCVTTTANAYMARVQNGSGTTDNKDVTFRANNFRSEGRISVIAAETSELFSFEGNTLRNCRIATQVNNQKFTVLKSNQMLFDFAAAAAFDAINTGQNNNGGKCEVVGNTIRTVVAQPSGSRAINVYQFDFNSNPINEIADNKMSGWTAAMKVEWAGTNSGFKAYTFIRRNNFGDAGSTLTITESGATASVVVKDANYRDDNTTVT